MDGSLELYIPAIGITRTIWDGTDAQTLSKGVGLYEYAQLPGEGNRNVSLAGHRNGLDKNGNVTDHAPFYYVDTLGEGTISPHRRRPHLPLSLRRHLGGGARRLEPHRHHGL